MEKNEEMVEGRPSLYTHSVGVLDLNRLFQSLLLVNQQAGDYRILRSRLF